MPEDQGQALLNLNVKWQPGAPALFIAGQWVRSPDGSSLANREQTELDPWQQMVTVITNPILQDHFEKCEFVSLVNHVFTIKISDKSSLQWIREHCRFIIKAILIGMTNDPDLRILLIEATNG